MPRGVEVPLVNTGGWVGNPRRGTPEARTQAAAWVRRRLPELIAAYQAVTGCDAATARRAALAGVALWARETGWGRSEWNHNRGNIRSSGTWPGGQWMTLAGQTYRSYPDASAGAQGWVRLVTNPTYARAWAVLRDGDDTAATAERWYRTLLQCGYSAATDAAVAEYSDIYPSVVARAA